MRKSCNSGGLTTENKLSLYSHDKWNRHKIFKGVNLNKALSYGLFYGLFISETMENISATRNISLTVLPFQVLPPEPQVEIFCQGLVMDVITDISRFRPFQITAYETAKSFTPDGQSVSPQLNGLPLDYVVKGLVRHLRDELTFNLQLIHVKENRLVWAEKYSGSFEELFQIQENIVEKIVFSLQHFVDFDLLADIRKKPLPSLGVYECWLRGYQELKKGTLEADEQARSFFQKALDLDPTYSRACTGMSLSYFNEWSCQLWSRWDVSRNGAFEWAQKALELDEWDNVSNAIIGRIYLFNGEYEKAEHFLRKSLRINPNDAETLVLIAYGLTYLGYAKEAVELYERARRLNPADNFMSHACGAFVHFEMGKPDEAISLAEHYEIGKGWVDFAAYQAAAYFMKGDFDKMQEKWQLFLKEFSEKINGGKPADTSTALRWMINVNPYRYETRLRPFWEYIGKTEPEKLLAARQETPAAPLNSFSQQGELWTMAYEGKQVQLPDLKGYSDLARLLGQPGKEIHCTDLMGAVAIEKGEEVFDEKAKAAYQKRILELQAAIREAEDSFDTRQLAALQDEYDQLIGHLSRSVGKGGKARKVAGTVEKCRTAVTWRIRSAMKKIAEAHPALGRHLENSIRTGVFCVYAPESEMHWLV